MKISPSDIAFDIDGVFADTFRVFVEKARNEYGCGFYYEDITEYDFMKVIDISQQTSEEIIQSLLEYPLENGVGVLPLSPFLLVGWISAMPMTVHVSSRFCDPAYPQGHFVLNSSL